MNISGKMASQYVKFDPDFDKNEQIGVASIDLRISEDVVIYPPHALYGLSTYLVSSLESVDMPENLSALLTLRTSTFRRGLALASLGFVDPGYRGNLTFRLTHTNSYADGIIRLNRGDRVAQLIFLQVLGNSDLYGGKYQDSTGTAGYIPD